MTEAITGDVERRRGIAGQDAYLPAAVERYLRRPRGGTAGTFDPAQLRPRWRAVIAASAVFLALLVSGLLVRVPTGATGTVAVVERNSVAMVMTDDSITETDRQITVLAAERPIAGTVIDVQWHPYIKLPGPMVTVEFADEVDVNAFSIGGQVVVERGTRPILIDLIGGGEL
ncbi:hypothetical protein E1295_30325 [Nonomuraea mesophila]|uniref:Uncharacterized protein n=1 Tax=Nonomuraea mesophila TaxID=2530382 RepID=A0A4R5F2F4_9ACTN|nr:hypothetical protein [Nonomuraea mesophila]TDE41380.1 hypothetical protein E1295_30325 [Nonomuraea mesophila]